MDGTLIMALVIFAVMTLGLAKCKRFKLKAHLLKSLKLEVEVDNRSPASTKSKKPQKRGK